MENIANEGEMLAEFCGTYHVSLSQDSHLRFIVGESDESEPFGLTRLYILLDLGHENFSERFKVCSELLLCGLPWQSEDNEIRALAPLHSLCLAARQSLANILRPPLVLQVSVSHLRGDADEDNVGPAGAGAVRWLEQLPVRKSHSPPGPRLGGSELETAGPRELGRQSGEQH